LLSNLQLYPHFVMAGLDPAIQQNEESSGVRTCADGMAASRAAMTIKD